MNTLLYTTEQLDIGDNTVVLLVPGCNITADITCVVFRPDDPNCGPISVYELGPLKICK